MKKLAIVCIMWFLLCVWYSPFSHATNFQNQDTSHLPWVPKAPSSPTTDVFKDGKDSTATALLDGIKLAINRVLWLLALIALIILIYQWVIMLVNAKDSKKIDEWYTTVKNVAIALIFIWVSWLIVSFIFWAIGVFTGKS